MQQESLMKEQAVRIERIHQEEFLWQSTATWEQLWEQKKGRLSRSQEMKEELPTCFLSLPLAFRGVVVKK